jgi:ABC-type polysaccharide/polyol phosphate export permease
MWSISGYFAFNFFSQTLNGGVQAAVGSTYLTRSSYFPQEVLVVSSALARLLEFLGELAIVMVLLAIFHHKKFPLSFIMLGPLVPILLLFALGLSFPLVTLAVYFKDTIQIIPLATMVFFYVSPIFYNVELVPENLRRIYLLNPMASMITLYHDVLYRGKIPDLKVLFTITGVSILLGIWGYVLFNRKKREFAEII